MDIDSSRNQTPYDSAPATDGQPERAREAATTAPLPTAPARSGRSGGWRTRSLAAGALAAVAIGSGTTGAALAGHFSSNAVGTVVTASTPIRLTGSTTGASEQLAKVAAAVQPSVVSVMVATSGGSGEGSGVILRSNGTILTNNHVVSDAANGGGSIRVRLADGKTVAATIVGRDPGTDLAVIRASGVSGLSAATLGSSANLHVGDAVLAIGSPLGLDGSVTAGIVSALHRTVSLGDSGQRDPSNRFGQSQSSSAAVGDAIQTDAAINPGNSGGALVDSRGAVVGINTAIASLGGSSSGNIGLGFAIPVDEARSVADQLIAGKTPQHALLGVQISDDPAGGAAITSVTPNGAAARAGLRAGDVITKLGATSIDGGSSLAAAVRSHRPGEQATVNYRRGGEQLTASVTFGSAAL